jgi:hypothetical protein
MQATISQKIRKTIEIIDLSQKKHYKAKIEEETSFAALRELYHLSPSQYFRQEGKFIIPREDEESSITSDIVQLTISDEIIEIGERQNASEERKSDEKKLVELTLKNLLHRFQNNPEALDQEERDVIKKVFQLTKENFDNIDEEIIKKMSPSVSKVLNRELGRAGIVAIARPFTVSI